MKERNHILEPIILQGQAFTNPKKSHAYLAYKLDFPTYYGANLDALYDMLTQERNLIVEIHDAREIVAQMDSYGIRLLDTLSDAAHANPRFVLVLEW